MRLIISNSSPTPIYEQIKTAIIEQIISDDLKENEPLPSIRNLALDLKISVMTIKKAYDELEKEGYIKSIQGKGTFIAPKNTGLLRENAQKQIEEHLLEVVELAKDFDISEAEIVEIITMFYGGSE